jgi:glycerate kinase
MKIVVASDSFKGCLGSAEVADAVERGIRRVLPGAEVVKIAVADGGEGTVRALVTAKQGELIRVQVHDPLMRPVEAEYGILPGGTAVIEMAAASGLPLLRDEERNPLVASTYGTGELILSALDRGCRKFIAGIGGSATNDGGAGMLRALGANFHDANGELLGEGGAALSRLASIDLSGMDRRLAESGFVVAGDVGNPLCGEHGASRVFGPQKGATPDMVELLDAALENYAGVAEKTTGRDIANIPGAGAAGGLGAAFMGFLNAQMESGIGLIIKETGLREKLRGADLLITGEGKMDRQSGLGKAAYGIMRVGRELGVPVAAIVGVSELTREEFLRAGFAEVTSLREMAGSEEESMRRAGEWLGRVSGKLVAKFIRQS